MQELWMAKDDVGLHSRIVFSHKGQSSIIFRDVDAMGTVTLKVSHTGRRKIDIVCFLSLVDPGF